MKNNAIWRPSWVATIPEVNTPAFGVRVVGQCRGPLRTGQLQDPHGGVVVIEHRPPPGVVMWRIYSLNKLGREVPQAPCTIYFEDAEWKALMVFTTQNPVVPKEPPTLREAIHRVAGLGGFLGRTSDGEPGTQTLWLGLQRLDDIAAMWLVMFYATQKPVSSRDDSG